MRSILNVAALALTAALAFGAATSANVGGGNDNRNSNTAAAHAAAVKRCRDQYDAARAAAMKIKTQPERNNALDKAKADYDACKKSADTARY